MTNDEPKNKLVILRGLPTRNKRIFARDWVDEDADWRLRVSRDDKAEESYGNNLPDLTRHQGENILHSQLAVVEAGLAAKLSVIIDDVMNLESKTVKYWYNIADKHGADVEVIDVDTPLEKALAEVDLMDSQYTEEDVRDLYSRYYKKGKPRPAPKHDPDEPLGRAYTPNPDLPKAVWVDVDGTLARMVGRPPFAWDRVAEDEPIMHVIEVVHALQKDGYKIVIMSGRDEVCQPETVAWLEKHGIFADAVHMRPANSYTPDDLVKHDLFWEHVAPKFDVRFALDDRDKVVKFTRDVLKIPVFQVAPGNF